MHIHGLAKLPTFGGKFLEANPQWKCPMYFNILGCFSAGSTQEAQRTHPFVRGYYVT